MITAYRKWGDVLITLVTEVPGGWERSGGGLSHRDQQISQRFSDESNDSAATQHTDRERHLLLLYSHF